MDLDLLEKSITKKTKAIIIVHLTGSCCNMDKLMAIVKKYNLILIEDCAQSHGAFFKSKKLGSFGLLSTFSFYPGKNLGALGDGGAIKIENLNYTINGNKIFKNFNCHILKNKITIIKGSIGTGKSTLLKIIMGLLEPEYGRIFKDTIEINDQNTNDWMHDIAFIGQHPILFNRSVKENIYYPNKGLSSLQEKVLENMEYKNIFAKIIDKKEIGIGGQKLSGGQKQIISIFRTLKENKNIILLDEPTSDLDPDTRNLIYKLLLSIKSFNKTIIIVTHDLELINLGDEIIDLSHKRN